LVRYTARYLTIALMLSIFSLIRASTSRSL
jgi:hypothetical protein